MTGCRPIGVGMWSSNVHVGINYKFNINIYPLNCFIVSHVPNPKIRDSLQLLWSACKYTIVIIYNLDIYVFVTGCKQDMPDIKAYK